MTTIALILSILLGNASLAIGYGQGGAAVYTVWFLLLGWIVHLWSILDAALWKPRGAT